MFLVQKVILRIHYMRILNDIIFSPIVISFIINAFKHYCKTIIQFVI